MKLRRINYPSLSEPVGPYVHAVKYENTLYLSGLTAFGTDAQFDNIENQAREIFRQIQEIVVAESRSLIGSGQTNDERKEFLESTAKNLPSKCIGSPKDIGEAAVFIMSNLYYR